VCPLRGKTIQDRMWALLISKDVLIKLQARESLFDSVPSVKSKSPMRKIGLDLISLVLKSVKRI